MIVITNPVAVDNEISIIHSLFAEGLKLLHLRKPDFSEEEMKMFVAAIGLEFRSQLALHSHHHLADEFGIDRLHFSEKDRLQLHATPARCRSTSVHSIQDFNGLENNFEYAFLSPIYPSISKPGYVSQQNHLEDIRLRTNFSTKLVALGGIWHENIQQALEKGFDDVALLGTLWNSTNPIENFKKCQKIVRSYSL
jgi:thiamine-phosphate pyrophosphorylase